MLRRSDRLMNIGLTNVDRSVEPPKSPAAPAAADHHEAEYQHYQSDVDQEGENEIGEDEGNDFDLEEGNEIPEYVGNDFDHEEGNEIPEGEGTGDDTDGDYGMSESDHEDIDLWII
uniref:Uncharacterized protein n=1 Tax=Oryza meridionalis TaxID=40149 RepID=A0A0E0CJ87_9ORYZ